MNKELFFEELRRNSSFANFIYEDSVLFFDEIESTNSYLHELASKSQQDCTWTIAAADSQTKGRGRLQRSFYSPGKNGLYFSFCIEPAGGVKNPADYTVVSSVAVCRAIERVFGEDRFCKIKWVNDIYIGPKKICGILTEGIMDASASRIKSAVVGIGINIFDDPSLPLELKEKAGSITGCTAENFKSISADEIREKLLAQIIAELLEIFESKENIIKEYKERSNIIGRKLSVTPVVGNNSTTYQATAVDITADAGLVVEIARGVRKILHTGEVTLSL